MTKKKIFNYNKQKKDFYVSTKSANVGSYFNSFLH